MTVEVARRLGWEVDRGTDGAWGRKGSRLVWRLRRSSWDAGVYCARTHDALAGALDDVRDRVSRELGISPQEFDRHLRKVLQGVR